ncbi:MAG: hypothetical protein ACYC5F_02405 [Thermoleophilia bacterium]
MFTNSQAGDYLTLNINDGSGWRRIDSSSMRIPAKEGVVRAMARRYA